MPSPGHAKRSKAAKKKTATYSFILWWNCSCACHRQRFIPSRKRDRTGWSPAIGLWRERWVDEVVRSGTSLCMYVRMCVLRSEVVNCNLLQEESVIHAAAVRQQSLGRSSAAPRWWRLKEAWRQCKEVGGGLLPVVFAAYTRQSSTLCCYCSK